MSENQLFLQIPPEIFFSVLLSFLIDILIFDNFHFLGSLYCQDEFRSYSVWRVFLTFNKYQGSAS